MKIKNIFIICGILMIIGGLGLFTYNMWDNYRAFNEANEVLDELKEKRENINNNIEGKNMDILDIKIGDYNYIGIITIPKIDLELPVIDSFSNQKLKKGPCLYYGSVDQNNMVIAAHDYPSQFGKLKKLEKGDKIIFEDIMGNVFEYTVDNMETLSPNDVDEMKSGDWDLTLFTCTLSGSKRTTIRAKKKI